uniref:Uncharacterized protein n=1 Tax=Anopheles albimanus TaxID=7167 RepID=A0A182FY51_ANOAL
MYKQRLSKYCSSCYELLVKFYKVISLLLYFKLVILILRYLKIHKSTYSNRNNYPFSPQNLQRSSVISCNLVLFLPFPWYLSLLKNAQPLDMMLEYLVIFCFFVLIAFVSQTF